MLVLQFIHLIFHYLFLGNHDVTFEPEYYKKFAKRYHDVPFGSDGAIVKEALTNCHYLEDQELVINDIRIWGIDLLINLIRL